MPGAAAGDVTQRPVRRLADSHAWSRDHFGVGQRVPGKYAQRPAIETGSIEMAIDAERLAQFPRTVGQLPIVNGSSARAREHLASEELHGANQYRAANAFRTGDGIHAPMHAIDEVDVSRPRRTMEVTRAFRPSAGAVTGGIVRAQICLDLHDSPRHRASGGAMF